MAPTTPAMHWAMMSLGLLMMNSGEPMTGKTPQPCFGLSSYMEN
jgi:hypothetical protein